MGSYRGRGRGGYFWPGKRSGKKVLFACVHFYRHLGLILGRREYEYRKTVEVADRVRKQFQESRQKIEHLLKKVITSQEDERKRVARGLHDTILQDTSAFLIKLDICRAHPELITVEKIDEMRKIALETIDNIHIVMKDLRPSILDDLGLDPAIMRLLETHLQGKGIPMKEHYAEELLLFISCPGKKTGV